MGLTTLIVAGLVVVSRHAPEPVWQRRGHSQLRVFRVAGDKDMVTDIQFRTGKLDIESATSNEAVTSQVELNPRVMTTFEKSFMENGHQVLYLRQKMRSKRLGSSAFAWKLALPKTVTQSIKIENRTSTQHLDFTGIPLKSLKLKTVASKMTVLFLEPNPERLTVDIDSGASDCHFYGLSNANIASLTFTSSAGNYVLDFSGDKTPSGNVELKGGVGRAKLVLPASANVRIVFQDTLMIKTTITGFFKTRSDEYISEHYHPGKPELRIHINLKSGSLTINTKE
ncbi:MAG: hypothetical protein AB7F28_00720 [Candidatus Margulisiibacteriota bacterium]